MASVQREIVIHAPVEHVWDALRDYGKVHTRVVPGFVLECRLEGDVRIVKFANGLEAREQLVTMDDAARRVVYTSTGGRLAHHNASVQLFAEGAGTRFLWTTDLLPAEFAELVAGMMDAGITIAKETPEGSAAAKA